MRFESYQHYRASREYKLLRRRVRQRSGGICERCHVAPADACHHYKGYFYQDRCERPGELIHLCDPCHKYEEALSDYDPLISVIQRATGCFVSTKSPLRASRERYRDELRARRNKAIAEWMHRAVETIEYAHDYPGTVSLLPLLSAHRRASYYLTGYQDEWASSCVASYNNARDTLEIEYDEIYQGQ